VTNFSAEKTQHICIFWFLTCLLLCLA